MQGIYPKLAVRLPDGRLVGSIEQGVFYRSFRGSLHLLQRPVPALAIDTRVYDAYRPYFHELRWTDTETGRVYILSAPRFDALRWTLERGYGRQYAVALRYWHCVDPKQSQLALAL